jgi:hypothetical protein
MCTPRILATADRVSSGLPTRFTMHTGRVRKSRFIDEEIVASDPRLREGGREGCTGAGKASRQNRGIA